MLSQSRKTGSEAARAQRRDRVAKRRTASSYAIMLLEEWKDPALLSMVGRFAHQGRYIDVIYLPANHPTSIGWAQAVRTLQRDRLLAPARPRGNRMMRITGNGTERVTRIKGRKADAATVKSWKPLPQKSLRTVEAGFTKRLLPRLRSSPGRVTGDGNTVRLIRWPQ
jgi:hypothetical protein